MMANDGVRPRDQELRFPENKTEKRLPSAKKESRASLLLYGLDLTEDEVQHLETEFKDLVNFRSVTNDDLEDIGIKNPIKRAVLLERLKSYPEPRGKEKSEIIQPLGTEESLKIIKQDKLHLEVLQSLLLCLRKTRADAKYMEGGLLDNEWSVEDAVKALTKVSIREAALLCDRIQELQESLQKEKIEEGISLQNQSSRPYLRWTMGIILIAATGVFFWRRYSPSHSN